MKEELIHVTTVVVSICSGGLSLLTQLMDVNYDLDCKIVLVDFGIELQPANRKERVLIEQLRSNKLPVDVCDWDKHLLNMNSNTFARSYLNLKSNYRYEIHPPAKSIIRQLVNAIRKIAAII